MMVDALVWNVVRHTRDLASMLRFYRDLLGLKVLESWDNPDSRGAVLAAGGRVENTTIEVLDLAGLAVPGQAPVNLDLSIEVADVDAWHDELEVRGVAIARGLEDTPWGHRSFGVDDPDGLRIWFVQVIGEQEVEL